MTYRVLLQCRLTEFFSTSAAIGIASQVFDLAHFSLGPAVVVLMDIGSIMLVSLLYGLMFTRRKNI